MGSEGQQDIEMSILTALLKGKNAPLFFMSLDIKVLILKYCSIIIQFLFLSPQNLGDLFAEWV